MEPTLADKNNWLQHPGEVLVIGYARSGEAAARLLSSLGFVVTVNDYRDRPENDADVTQLEQAGVRFAFGGHPITLLERSFQFIVKNPGIPYHMPLIVAAMERKIPVFSEIEIASWFTDAPIYAITGSNGKTTTTTLVGEMLRVAGHTPAVAGNIGTAFAGLVASHATDEPFVLEVSSFQLMGTHFFHPRIAALLNFYPAHLDYHGSFEQYQAAKWRIFENMRSSDVAVLNKDDDIIREKAAQLACHVHWFSVDRVDFEDGAAVADGDVVLLRNGVARPIMRVSDVGLRGSHNLQNVLAAAAIAQAGGAPYEAIQTVARSFQGVEHRMEFVRTVDGVRYYNDSKATNADASRPALQAFERNLVWIAGGLDRGVSFESLVPDIAGRVKAAILIGETKMRLRDACQLANVPNIRLVESIEEAVQTACSCATAGDTVLLSPACASWDMFTSFEVRGSMFKDAVHRL